MPKKRIDRQKSQTAKRRNQARKALDALGLCDDLSRGGPREHFLNCHYPQIEVALSPDTIRSTEADGLLSELKSCLKRATYSFPIIGDWPIVDYFSFVKPILDGIQAMTSKDDRVRDLLDAAREHTRRLHSVDSAAEAIAELFRSFEEKLIRIGRIDSRLYFLSVETGRKSGDKYQVRFELHCHIAAPRTVKTTKGERPAYRCGQACGASGIQWVTWPPSVLGLNADAPHIDVYVQSHALDNLYRKEARALFIEDGEHWVHDFLWQSLLSPVLIPLPQASRKFLAEYKLFGHKIGYLVIQPVDGVALVESFLFLTMDGTPEGDALWRNLKLRQTDKKYLELDRIRTFLFTDLQNDQELIRILDDCGCGHLFKMLREPMPNRASGYASEVRRYLRL